MPWVCKKQKVCFFPPLKYKEQKGMTHILEGRRGNAEEAGMSGKWEDLLLK